MKTTTALLTAAIALFLFSSCKKDLQGKSSEDNTIETLPPVMTALSVNAGSDCAGYYEALPSRYDSSSKQYPLLLFFHGIGELGNGGSDLKNLLRTGLPRLIYQKKFPADFQSGGRHFSFIVISPQFKTWPTNAQVNEVLQYALQRYRVDRSRIYATGLSMGGGVTWDFSSEYGAAIAAAAPICGGSWPDNTRAANIASFNLPVWAFHNEDDPTVPVSYSRDYVSKINSHHPAVPARLTTWPTGGHDAWTKTYDPSYKENGMNVYEWMLQYTRPVQSK